ncbi:MAG: nucleotidyltransferase domain-containing protein [Bryobacterales bacterium]|nr:nucleotidyltransferase domain-containing protein [Bryobacterales bacterium]MDE0296026.1 nucleotidyltransferase domain-containing protein [Bryobacterales bacterium]
MRARRILDQETLDEIIRRIVEVARPEKIILFGSAARGKMGPHSDVDLLIIKEGADVLELTGEIYMNLDGIGVAIDAVVVTPGDVERYRDSHAVIIKPALREGRVIYEAA